MIKIGFIGTKHMYQGIISKIQNNNKVEVVFIDVQNKPIIKIEDLDYCIIRSTKNRKKEVNEFIKVNSHVNFLDNLERFNEKRDKLKTSLERSKLTIGPFTYKSAISPSSFKNPLVAKPIDGKKNKGLIFINTKEEYKTFLTQKQENLHNYIIQDKIDFVDEFRLLMFNAGKELSAFYATRKKSVAGKENPKKHSIPSSVTVKRLVNFIYNARPEKTGIIGFDIGLTNKSKDDFYIIEENRSPLFNRTEKLLGISIYKELINFIVASHNYPSK